MGERSDAELLKNDDAKASDESDSQGLSQLILSVSLLYDNTHLFAMMYQRHRSLPLCAVVVVVRTLERESSDGESISF